MNTFDFLNRFEAKGLAAERKWTCGQSRYMYLDKNTNIVYKRNLDPIKFPPDTIDKKSWLLSKRSELLKYRTKLHALAATFGVEFLPTKIAFAPYTPSQPEQFFIWHIQRYQPELFDNVILDISFLLSHQQVYLDYLKLHQEYMAEITRCFDFLATVEREIGVFGDIIGARNLFIRAQENNPKQTRIIATDSLFKITNKLEPETSSTSKIIVQKIEAALTSRCQKK